ncbi:MAG: hypothetical protein AB8G15_14430 [Saprospiraceae bacterium]
MKKLMLLFAFTLCLFVSSNLMAANTLEVIPAEIAPVENVFDAADVAEEDLIIICASGGIDVFIDGDYVGTFDCVIF